MTRAKCVRGARGCTHGVVWQRPHQPRAALPSVGAPPGALPSVGAPPGAEPSVGAPPGGRSSRRRSTRGDRSKCSLTSRLAWSPRACPSRLCECTAVSFIASPTCTGGRIAQVAIWHRWPCYTGGRVAHVAVLHAWPHCTRGHIARVATLHAWPHCTRGHIARVATLHAWPHCTGDRIAQVAPLCQQ